MRGLPQHVQVLLYRVRLGHRYVRMTSRLVPTSSAPLFCENTKPRTRRGARAHCMHPLHSHGGHTAWALPRPRRLSTLLQRSFGLRRLAFSKHGDSYQPRTAGSTLWTGDLLAGSATRALYHDKSPSGL